MIISRLSDLDSHDEEAASVSSSSTKSSKRRRLKRLLTKKPFKIGSKSGSKSSLVNEDSSEMQSFFEQIETIESNIRYVKKANTEVKQLHKRVVTCTSAQQEKKISEEFHRSITQTNLTIKGAIARLQLLQNDTATLTNADEETITVRKNVIAACSQQFKDEASAYRQTQEDYKRDLEAKMKRQIRMVNPTLTEVDIDEMINDGADMQSHLQQQILLNRPNKAIKTAYLKAQCQYQHFLVLETSVAQLQQMFLDMALLTDLQGKKLDRIELDVHEGVETTEAANEDLAQAVKIRKKVRRKQFILLLIGVVAVSVLIAILV